MVIALSISIILFSVIISLLPPSTSLTSNTPQASFVSYQSNKTADLLFSKKVLPDRLDQYLNYLQDQGVGLQDLASLSQLNDPLSRRRIVQDHHIDSLWLLVHVELAQLMEIGLISIDAQMLHFSHWNYQCPFSGVVMNPEILAATDPESILMDIQGCLLYTSPSPRDS